jgi:hypothetical protein
VRWGFCAMRAHQESIPPPHRRCQVRQQNLLNCSNTNTSFSSWNNRLAPLPLPQTRFFEKSPLAPAMNPSPLAGRLAPGRDPGGGGPRSGRVRGNAPRQQNHRTGIHRASIRDLVMPAPGRRPRVVPPIGAFALALGCPRRAQACRPASKAPRSNVIADLVLDPSIDPANQPTPRPLDLCFMVRPVPARRSALRAGRVQFPPRT